MFKLDQIRAQQLGTWEESVGAEEEFGPAKPTAIETVTQYAMDLSGLSKNVLIAAGVGVGAYLWYRFYYSAE
jgi:hypothetical protein